MSGARIDRPQRFGWSRVESSRLAIASDEPHVVDFGYAVSTVVPSHRAEVYSRAVRRHFSRHPRTNPIQHGHARRAVTRPSAAFATCGYGRPLSLMNDRYGIAGSGRSGLCRQFCKFGICGLKGGRYNAFLREPSKAHRESRSPVDGNPRGDFLLRLDPIKPILDFKSTPHTTPHPKNAKFAQNR